MAVYRINKTRLAELVDKTIKYVVEADLKDVTSIRYYAFRYCTLLTSIIIPNSVTSIGNYAFAHCTSLTSITLPSGLTSIGTQVFYSCSSLMSVEIPNSVESIGEYAFGNCTSLTSITIPDSVTSIGWAAFISCTSLTEMTVLATTPPTLASDSFQSSGITATTGKIRVPFSFDHSILNAYKTATNWSNYADIMSESTPVIEF